MGCGCFPDRKSDDEFQESASKPFLKVPAFTIRYNEEETVSFESDGSCNCNECGSIQRVIKALKYYHNIDIIKHQTELIEFATKYTELLNDFHHMLFVHENDISHIHKLLMNKYEISACHLYKCVIVQRNQTDAEEEDVIYDIDNDEINNVELTFWIDLFDNIHCYLLHIYDYGYLTNDDKPEREGDEDFFVTGQYLTKFNDCSDPSFVELKQYILEKKKHLERINAVRRSPYKYNILFAQNGGDEKTAAAAIDFNIGLKFYYWEHYKNKQGYVDKKYCDIKQEILNNSIYKLDKRKYDIIMRKAEKLIDTAYAKSIRADFVKDHHYGIAKGVNIGLQNIFSMLLYVDHHILAEHLLKTFCAQRPNEQLFSIKKRHRQFRNWSCLLRETVDYFGVNASELNSCYVGCKYVVAPSISLRLRSATSTSKRLAVAMRFINDIKNGMILEIKHNEHGSNDMKGFVCHWLSNFSGEYEVVFMGGKHTMQISSIRNVATNANFGNYFGGLYYFDLMLMGIKISWMASQAITNNDYELLNDIITRQTTSTSKTKNTLFNRNKDIDGNVRYMQDMFNLYCKQKETLIIDLILVDKYYKMLKALIISERIENLVLFNHIGLLFPKVTEIAMYATTDRYKIDLLALFAEISKRNCKNIQKIQIRSKHTQTGSWLCHAWNQEIEFKFYTKHWKSKFVVGKGTQFDDVVTLFKKKES